VVVAGGAFNSPQLLKLSGIGPSDELERHGIPVRVDLPGVGRNLQDRYEVTVVHRMSKDFVLSKDLLLREPAEGEQPEQAWTEWLAGKGPYTTNGVVGAVIKRSRDDLPVADLFIFGSPSEFRGYYPGSSVDGFAHRDRFTWSVLKAHTQNQGGEVLLRSTDPRDTPDIRFHYFDEGTDRAGEDLDAVVEGVRFVRRLMREWQVPDGELVPGAELETDEQLRTFVRDEAWGHHASCSCPMGADGDPNAVLDNRLRVRGVDALRVVDASSFPRIPGFFIVTAVYMLSEKAAAMILSDHG
jgi:choline dehydrogenase